MFFFLRILEWIEFVEPLSSNHKYVNLKTGDSTYDKPLNVEMYV